MITKKWYQGDILQDRHLEKLTGCTVSEGQAGVVVSHSCDLAHHIAENEPYVELLVGEPVLSLDGNFTYGKHPRKLHLPIHLSGKEDHAVEFVPWRRHIVERQNLLENEPDRERYLLREDITVLAAWMAQRYQRAAFPDDFNAAVHSLGKRPKKIYARISPSVSGLYARIYPDRELAEGEHYSIDLLALVPDEKATELEFIHKEIANLAGLFNAAGMDTRAIAHAEGAISFSAVRSMRRFPLEYLSFRNTPHGPLPLG